MKPIKAYEDTTGNVHRQKSDALAADVKTSLRALAGKLNEHKAIPIMIGTFEEALLQQITPRRLMRMYTKVWKLRQQYDQAIAEENITKDDLPF
jgi:hypothetical protein